MNLDQLACCCHQCLAKLFLLGTKPVIQIRWKNAFNVAFLEISFWNGIRLKVGTQPAHCAVVAERQSSWNSETGLPKRQPKEGRGRQMWTKVAYLDSKEHFCICDWWDSILIWRPKPENVGRLHVAKCGEGQLCPGGRKRRFCGSLAKIQKAKYIASRWTTCTRTSWPKRTNHCTRSISLALSSMAPNGKKNPNEKSAWSPLAWKSSQQEGQKLTSSMPMRKSNLAYYSPSSSALAWQRRRRLFLRWSACSATSTGHHPKPSSEVQPSWSVSLPTGQAPPVQEQARVLLAWGLNLKI